MSIERLRQKYDIEVAWAPFPLHPEIPEDGITVAQLFAGREEYVDTMRQRLNERFEAEGLPFGEFDRIYNTRLAQELGKWADAQPNGGLLHDHLFRAYFVRGENIGAPENLVRLAGEVGLDEQEAAEILKTRAFSAAVDHDWDRAMGYRITGVPTFLAAGRGLVGAQPYEMLEELVRRAEEHRAADQSP